MMPQANELLRDGVYAELIEKLIWLEVQLTPGGSRFRIQIGGRLLLIRSKAKFRAADVPRSAGQWFQTIPVRLE